jgi:ADP-ribosyl-[dinitrogen reductase] hydrolase
MPTQTSKTHPINVIWVDNSQPGWVGITFAPGKHDDSKFSGCRWERDLRVDLDDLVHKHHAGLLVCLLQDRELVQLRIPTLLDEARARMQVLRLPIPDGGVLPEQAPVRAVVQQIVAAAAAGVNVVIHCRGGLGRAGTVAGCTLAQLGLSDDAIFTALRERHATSCPENEAQRDFIRSFARDVRANRVQRQRADRMAGAVLGAAIGDALGHPTEFMDMAAIHAKHGPAGVAGFTLWWTRDGARFAPYTDDTQMAEAVLVGLLAGRTQHLDLDGTMGELARRFVDWAAHPQGGHRAPGNACLAGCRALAQGVPWREAGGATAGGCGSVMRAWPFGLVFVDDLARAEEWAVAHSALTHRDPIALAACAALARGVALAVRGAEPDAIATDMVRTAARHSPSTAALVQGAIDDVTHGVQPDVTLDRLRGWAAHEAIAAALYVFLRHPNDPRAALLEGANTPGDSDSIASLAGALVGARCGLAALPSAWVYDVERSDALLALAASIPLGVDATVSKDGDSDVEGSRVPL